MYDFVWDGKKREIFFSGLRHKAFTGISVNGFSKAPVFGNTTLLYLCRKYFGDKNPALP
jgi:hypothetical protein